MWYVWAKKGEPVQLTDRPRSICDVADYCIPFTNREDAEEQRQRLEHFMRTERFIKATMPKEYWL